jgi:hypothetical protein
VDASDQTTFPDVTPADLPPAPAAPSAQKPGPSFPAILRGVVFTAAAAAALIFAGRRWAEAYHRFRAFRAFDPTPLLAAAPAVPAAPKSAAADAPVKQPRAVVFHLAAPDAKSVLLGGDFNDFDARQNPLTQRSDGTWETTLTLAPGRYAYKFKVDGRWTLDPANTERSSKKEASLLDIQ